MESIVLFASFFILLIMMVPIGYAIGIATPVSYTHLTLPTT